MLASCTHVQALPMHPGAGCRTAACAALALPASPPAIATAPRTVAPPHLSMALPAPHSSSQLSLLQILFPISTNFLQKNLVKDRGIVIFMYPRANTGGCTKQVRGVPGSRGPLSPSTLRGPAVARLLSCQQPRRQAHRHSCAAKLSGQLCECFDTAGLRNTHPHAGLRLQGPCSRPGGGRV